MAVGEARIVGLLLVAVGVLIFWVGLLMASGWLSWFGHLPGDIHIRGEHVEVFIPATSMLLVALALSVLGYLLNQLFGRR